MAGFKVGIVTLGKAAGKIKYALLDERDISLVEQYAFEAKVDVDPDGNGAHIYAYTYSLNRGKCSGQYLQDFLWERHCGGIAPGWKVVHKNGVTVDNRMENLMLVPEKTVIPSDDQPSTKNREQSLYWIAVQQLHVTPLESEYMPHPIYNKFYSPNGENVYIGDEELSMYYECHYPPCTNMEKQVREYSICGRCQEVRYCGTYCQQKDWPVHKKFCRERRKLIEENLEPSPDR